MTGLYGMIGSRLVVLGFVGLIFWMQPLFHVHASVPPWWDLGIYWDQERSQPYVDTDKDGIMDAMDWDIDGDQIHNVVDKDPLNPDFGSLDSDVDGIPDFVDFDLVAPFSSFGGFPGPTFQ